MKKRILLIGLISSTVLFGSSNIDNKMEVTNYIYNLEKAVLKAIEKNEIIKNDIRKINNELTKMKEKNIDLELKINNISSTKIFKVSKENQKKIKEFIDEK